MSVVDEAELTQRQRYWLDHVRGCEASGKTMRAYAAEIGVGERAFYDAKKRLVNRGVLNSGRQRRQGGGFVRAQVVGSVPEGGCRVVFPNGISVAFSVALEGEGLVRLLRTVATVV